MFLLGVHVKPDVVTVGIQTPTTCTSTCDVDTQTDELNVDYGDCTDDSSDEETLSDCEMDSELNDPTYVLSDVDTEFSEDE